jgi:hypothetical protein
MYTAPSQDLVQRAAAACGTLTASSDWVGVSSRWDADQSGFDRICGIAFDQDMFMIVSALRDDHKSVLLAAGACKVFQSRGLTVAYADAYQAYAAAN